MDIITDNDYMLENQFIMENNHINDTVIIHEQKEEKKINVMNVLNKLI